MEQADSAGADGGVPLILTLFSWHKTP